MEDISRALWITFFGLVVPCIKIAVPCFIVLGLIKLYERSNLSFRWLESTPKEFFTRIKGKFIKESPDAER